MVLIRTTSVIKHLLMGFCLIFSFFSAHAAVEVNVINVSLSEKSIVINLGSLEGIRERHISQFYLKNGTEDHPVYTLYGEGEAIRIFADRSFWYLQKSEESKKYKLKKGDKLIFLSQNETLKGSRPPKIKSTHKVLGEGIVTTTDLDIPEHLLYKNESYYKKGTLIPRKKSLEFDGEIIKEASFTRYSGIYQEDFKKEIDHNLPMPIEEKGTSEFKDDHSLKAYRSITKGSVDKLNVEGPLKIHHWQKENKIRNRGDKISEYDLYREKKLKDLRGTREVDEKLKRDGVLWSADFTDDELRNYIYRKGILTEKERRERVVSSKSANEVSLSLSSDMTSNATSNDLNYQSKGYSLNVGYEYHLQRTTIALQRFSVEASASWGVDSYQIGPNINGRFQTGVYTGGLNIYIHNYPTTINDYMLYLGAGVSKGQAKVTSDRLSKDYVYQISSLPIFYLGLKYRYQNREVFEEDLPVGFGFNFRLSTENTEISSLDTIKDDLYGSNSFSNVKMQVGLSLYF